MRSSSDSLHYPPRLTSTADINVEAIHNATFAASINNASLAHVRDLANYHETAVFTSPELNGIGNSESIDSTPVASRANKELVYEVAGRSLLPQIIANLKSFTNATAPSRMSYIGLAYKPFISIGNMTGVQGEGENQAYGLVNYAASFAFEIRQAMSGSGYEVRLNFKNGTDDADYRALPMFGSNNVDYPFDQFMDTLEVRTRSRNCATVANVTTRQPNLIANLSQWCVACGNTQDRGCDVVTAANISANADLRSGSVTTTYGQHDVSPLAAGFIGAGVTLAVVAAAFGLLALVGLVGFGKKRRGGASGNGVSHVESNDGSSSQSLTGEKSNRPSA